MAGEEEIEEEVADLVLQQNEKEHEKSKTEIKRMSPACAIGSRTGTDINAWVLLWYVFICYALAEMLYATVCVCVSFCVRERCI